MRHCVIPVLLVVAGAALAVSPASWNHQSEADFSPGKFDLTVVNSLGEISLSRELSLLMPSRQAPEAISALAVDGKTVYAASGVKAVIYKIAGRKAVQFAKLPGTMVTALLWDGKALLAAVSGEGAGIYTVDSSGKPTRLWGNKDAKYIWAMLAGPKDVIYAATGPNASVYAVDRSGGGNVIYKAGKLARNITCLARSKSDLLYAGTDESGLVVEIDLATKSSRVILDAAEKEISCLLPDAVGGLYVGTADADKADRGGAHEPKESADGRGVGAAPTATSQPADSEEPQDTEGEEAEAGDDPPTPESASAPAETMAEEEEDETPHRSAGDIARVISRLTAAAHGGGAAEGKGNAVYYVRPDGLVKTVFRRPVTVLAMLADDKRLILGTGNGGAIYSVSTDSDDAAQLANTDAKHVTCLAGDGDGSIYFATSNKGSVGVFGPRAAERGTFVSEPLDASQIAKWGTASMTVRGGGKITLATRSGNVEKAEDSTCSAWSPEAPAGEGFTEIASPPGRFLQYRLTLNAVKGSVPVVEQIEIIYQVGNLAPVVSSVKATPAVSPRKGQQEQTGPQAYRLIEFEASDANEDKLIYEITFRQVGSEGWVKLADKLDSPEHVWDTRGVGDGAYELRVTADDSPSNPPPSALQGHRISAPVIVDNTPPLVTHLAAQAKADAVNVNGTAEDRGSRVATIYYAVDSQDEWVAVLPTDGIADSPKESFAFKVKDLKSGPHRLAVKVTDLFGNAGYGTLSVQVGPATRPAAPKTR